MKIVKKGWIGKSVDKSEMVFWRQYGNTKELAMGSGLIWELKGSRFLWDDRDWPPRKVTVTVEVEE